jgi:outer membrane receptor protein involved in Fe transport
MRCWKVAVVGIWYFLMFLSPPVWAQVDEDCPDCQKEDKEEFLLDEVVVTAFRGGAVTLTPTKTIIDVEKFNKSGAVDRVEDILMHLTGIDVLRGSTGADPQQMIMMRGFDDSRFTIAIDGRTITAPTAGADTYVDWSSLTTGDIQQIEVIRGAASAQYENSQGGIINIITKKGRQRETMAPKVTLSGDYGSLETFNGRVTLDGGVGSFGYFLNYGHKESDGYLRNNYYTGNDYSARLTYDFPFDGSLTLSAKGSDIDLGFAVVNDPNSFLGGYDPSYPIVPEDSDTIRRYRSISFAGGDNYKKKRALHLDLIYDQVFDTGTMRFQLFQTTGDEDSYYYTAAKNSSYDPNVDPPDLEYVLKQSFSGNADREELHYGGRLQYKIEGLLKHAPLIGYDQRRMETGSMDDVWRMQAGYAEDTWALTDKLSLFLGLRYAHIREMTYAYADPGTSNKYRHKLYTDLWLPKSTLTYKVSRDTEVFVSVNKDYHVPGC